MPCSRSGARAATLDGDAAGPGSGHERAPVDPEVVEHAEQRVGIAGPIPDQARISGVARPVDGDDAMIGRQQRHHAIPVARRTRLAVEQHDDRRAARAGGLCRHAAPRALVDAGMHHQTVRGSNPALSRHFRARMAAWRTSSGARCPMTGSGCGTGPRGGRPPRNQVPAPGTGGLDSTMVAPRDYQPTGGQPAQGDYYQSTYPPAGGYGPRHRTRRSGRPASAVVSPPGRDGVDHRGVARAVRRAGDGSAADPRRRQQQRGAAVAERRRRRPPRPRRRRRPRKLRPPRRRPRRRRPRRRRRRRRHRTTP